jgi:putative redox protein
MIRATTHADSYRTAFTDGAYHAAADVPAAKGGDGQGFGPHDLLEAALATCMSISVAKAAKTSNASLTAVTCEVRIDRSVPGAVTLNYDLKLSGDLAEEQVERLHRAARECPVGRTLSGVVAIQSMTFV